MSTLPSAATPLNQHSLLSIELWLNTLGAKKNENNPCLWEWLTNECSAEIEIMQDELKVTWMSKEKESQFSFPYGLSRQDVEDALKQGP